MRACWKVEMWDGWPSIWGGLWVCGRHLFSLPVSSQPATCCGVIQSNSTVKDWLVRVSCFVWQEAREGGCFFSTKVWSRKPFPSMLENWCVCVCMNTCGGQRSTSGVGPHLLPCLRQNLLFVAACARRAGPRAPGDSSVSTSHLPAGVLRLYRHDYHALLSLGSGDPSSSTPFTHWPCPQAAKLRAMSLQWHSYSLPWLMRIACQLWLLGGFFQQVTLIESHLSLWIFIAYLYFLLLSLVPKMYSSSE